MAETPDIVQTLQSLLVYPYALTSLVIAILAFVRLKTTASGILIGGYFGLSVLVSITFRIVNKMLLVTHPSQNAFFVFMIVLGLVEAFLLLLLLPGIALIPSSLAKLAKNQKS